MENAPLAETRSRAVPHSATIHSTIVYKPKRSSSISSSIGTARNVTDEPTIPRSSARKRKLDEDAQEPARTNTKRQNSCVKQARHDKDNMAETIPAAQNTSRVPFAAAKMNESRRRDSPSTMTSGASNISGADKIAETIICKTTTTIAPPRKASSKILWGKARRHVERLNGDEDGVPIACHGNQKARSDAMVELEMQVAQDSVYVVESQEPDTRKVILDKSISDENGGLPDYGLAKDSVHHVKGPNIEPQSPIIIDLTEDLDPEPPMIIDLTAENFASLCSSDKISMPGIAYTTNDISPGHGADRALLPTLANILCHPVSQDDHIASMQMTSDAAGMKEQSLGTSTGAETRIMDLTPQDLHVYKQQIIPPQFIELPGGSRAHLSKIPERPSTPHARSLRGSETKSLPGDHEENQYLLYPAPAEPHKSHMQTKSIPPPAVFAPNIAPSKPRSVDAGGWEQRLLATSIQRHDGCSMPAVIPEPGPVSCHMPPLIEWSRFPGLPQMRATGITSSQSPGKTGTVLAGPEGAQQNQQTSALFIAPKSQRIASASTLQQFGPAAPFTQHQEKESPTAQQQSGARFAENRQSEKQPEYQLAPKQDKVMPISRRSQTIVPINQLLQQPPTKQLSPRMGESTPTPKQFGRAVPVNSYQQNIVYQPEVAQSNPDNRPLSTMPHRINKTPPLLPFEAEHLRKIVSSQPYRSYTTT